MAEEKVDTRTNKVVVYDLMPATNYVAEVQAWSGVMAGEGSWSPAIEFETITDETKPDPVTNLTGDASGSRFEIKWNNPYTRNEDEMFLANFREFKIVIYPPDDEENTAEVFTKDLRYILSAEANETMFGDVQPELTFEVYIIDQLDNESAPVSITLEIPLPTAPTLDARGSAGNVKLDWYGASGHIVRYEVFRNDDKIADVAGEDTAYNDSDVSRGTHTYFIRAVDRFGREVDSNSVTEGSGGFWEEDATPPATPTNPDGTSSLGVVGERRALAEVSWDAPITNNDGSDYDDHEGYEIRYRIDPARSWNYIVIPDDRTDGATAERFSVEIPRLVPGATLYWGVRALDRYGNRSGWLVHDFTLVEDTNPPEIPQGVGARGSLGAIFVDWDKNADRTDGYRLYASSSPNVSALPANLKYDGVANFASFSVGDDETWYVRVTAYRIGYDDTVYESDPGAEDSATSTLIVDDTPPGDVNFPSGGLTAQTYFHGSTQHSFIQASWDAVTNAVGYVLSYREAGGPWNEAFINSEETSYRLTGLAPDTTYEVRLKALSAFNVKSENWSDIRSVDTPSANATPVPSVTGFDAEGGVGQVRFTWDDADYDSKNDYHLQIATNATFTTNVRNIYIRSNEFFYNGISGETYYGRVRNRDQFNRTGAWSSTESAAVQRVQTDDVEENAIVTSRLADNAVDVDKLANLSVTDSKLVDGAVIRDKLADNAVNADKIADAAVVADKIDSAAVIREKLADNAVNVDKLANLSVTHDKLVDGAVIRDKLAEGAVDEDRLADAAVVESKLADNSVGEANIQDSSISVAKFASDLRPIQVVTTLPTLPNADYPNGSVVSYDGKLYRNADGEWTASVVVADIEGLIDTDNIADGAVIRAKLANNAVDEDVLADAAVKTDNLDDGAVTNAKVAELNAQKITSGTIAAARIDAAEIAARQAFLDALVVDTAQIANGAIGTAQINELNASVITAGTIATARLDTAAIAADQAFLANLVVDTAQIAEAAVGNAQIDNLDASKITAGTIATARIDTAAIAADQAFLNNLEVGDAQIVSLDAGTITSGTIAAARIDAAEIAARQAFLDALVVDTAQIANGAITNAKIDNLDASKITAGTISTARLDTAEIAADSAFLNNLVVDTAQIANGAIGDAQIDNLSASKITAGTIATARLDTAAIAADNAFLANLVVDTAQIAEGAIGTAEVGELNASVITAGQLDAARIDTLSIAAQEAFLEALTVRHIEADTINTTHIDTIDLSAQGIFTGRLNANLITVGGDTLFPDADYDPSTKATPDEVSAAEAAAKAYASNFADYVDVAFAHPGVNWITGDYEDYQFIESDLLDQAGATLNTDSETSLGGNVLRITDQIGQIYTARAIPVDVGKNYKVEVRFRMVTDNPNQRVKVGFACLDKNFQTIGEAPGPHRYFVMSGDHYYSGDGWIVRDGIIQGVGPDIESFKTGTRWIRPVFDIEDGTVEIDYFAVANIEGLIEAEQAANEYAETLDAAIRGDYGHTVDTTLIDGGKIFTGSVNGEVFDFDVGIVNGLQVQSLFRVNAGGSIESDNFDSGIEGYRLTTQSIEHYGPSFILGGNGLHINSEDGQMWFGNNDYEVAPFQIASTGSLRIGGAGKFYADASGNIWSGDASRTDAPWDISAEGAARFDNIRITGEDMTTDGNLLSAGGNFVLKRDGGVFKAELAGDMDITGGGNLRMDGGSITLDSGSMNMGGGNFDMDGGNVNFNAADVSVNSGGSFTVDSGDIVVSGGSGRIRSGSPSYNYSNEEGWALENGNLFLFDGEVHAKALRIQNGQNVLDHRYAVMSGPLTEFYTRSSTNGYSWSIDTNWSMYGGNSIRVVNTFGSARYLYLSTSTTVENTKVEPGETYIFSGYARNNGGSSTTVRIGYRTGGSTTIQKNVVIPAGDTVRVFAEYTLGGSVNDLMVALGSMNNGDVSWDAIQVEKKLGAISEPSPFSTGVLTTIDGGTITTGSIQSTNQGGSGPNWSIGLDGSATFTDGTFNGTIQADDGYLEDMTVQGRLAINAQGSIEIGNTNNGIYLDSTNGLRMWENGTKKVDIPVGGDPEFDGNIIGGTINIGSNAFNVNASGEIWSGGPSPTHADTKFRVESNGIMHATGAKFDGDIEGGTISINGNAFNVNSSGQLFMGASSYGTGAKFRVDTDGTLYTTGAQISGDITSGSTITGASIIGTTYTSTSINQQGSNITTSIEGNAIYWGAGETSTPRISTVFDPMPSLPYIRRDLLLQGGQYNEDDRPTIRIGTHRQPSGDTPRAIVENVDYFGVSDAHSQVTNSAWRGHFKAIRGSNTVDYTVTTNNGGAADMHVNGSRVAAFGVDEATIESGLTVSGNIEAASRIISNTNGSRTNPSIIVGGFSGTGIYASSSALAISHNGDWGIALYGDSQQLRSAWTRANSASVGSNLYINSDGYIFYGTSSARFKTDIRNMTMEEAERILAAEPVRFRGIGKGDHSGWTHYGFIAEQIRDDVDPRLVDFETDDDGNITNEVGGIHYQHIIPHLTMLIKDDRGKIEQLEEENTSLRDRLDSLEARLEAAGI